MTLSGNAAVFSLQKLTLRSQSPSRTCPKPRIPEARNGTRFAAEPESRGGAVGSEGRSQGRCHGSIEVQGVEEGNFGKAEEKNQGIAQCPGRYVPEPHRGNRQKARPALVGIRGSRNILDSQGAQEPPVTAIRRRLAGD